jgi:hypothetical protein
MPDGSLVVGDPMANDAQKIRIPTVRKSPIVVRRAPQIGGIRIHAMANMKLASTDACSQETKTRLLPIGTFALIV